MPAARGPSCLSFREAFRRRVTLVVIFESRRAQAEALDHILGLGLGDAIDIGHAALIACDAPHERVTVNNNVTALEGLYSGAILGAVIAGLGIVQLGVLGLPKGAAALALGLTLALGVLVGGAVGGLVARLIGFGFEPHMLRGVEDQLEPGQIALLLHVRAPLVPLLRRELLALATPPRVRDRSHFPPR